jgi:hypothetical protein
MKLTKALLKTNEKMEFTTEQKIEFLDSLIKQCQENIWTLEIQLMDSKEKLAKKKAYLDLIPKRMEEKFYPTAHDGREDEKETKAIIASHEMNVERYQEGIETEKQKIELIARFKDQSAS